MGVQFSLIDELEKAVQSGSQEKRLEALRQVTDLFIRASDNLSESQVAMFDDVLGYLIKTVESRALIELGERLAPVENAPIEVIRRLAHDDEIAVAGPVLTHSMRLTTDDLIEIAQEKGEEHRFAISGRAQLDEALTSVLLEYGERKVLLRLSSHPGARFSDAGFAALITKSQQEDSILEAISQRIDLPAAALQDLLIRASDTLRERLLSVANPVLRTVMQNTLKRYTDTIRNEVAEQQSAARTVVMDINRRGQLNESTICYFAQRKWRDEVIIAVELITASKFEFVERALGAGIREATLVLGKAAGFRWSTTCALIEMNDEALPAADAAALEAEYAKLTQYTAQRTLRFWQVKSALAG